MKKSSTKPESYLDDQGRQVHDAAVELASVIQEITHSSARELQDFTSRIQDLFKTAILSSEPNAFDLFKQETDQLISYITYKPIQDKKRLIQVALLSASRTCKALLLR